MKQKCLDYSIIIEPDKRTGDGKPCYGVYCPVLGLSDSGDTVEEAIGNIKTLIRFHLECLAKEGEDVPTESAEHRIFSTVQILCPN